MIVFVTAYDSYAIQAFEVNALDYLLKPIEPARLQDAIERARERAEMEAAVDTHEKFASALAAIESLGAGEPARPMRFVVRSGSKDLLIQANDVVWIEAADYYACLHVADKRHLLRESIKKLESQLDPGKFVRIHRSAIVNIDCVREIHREGQSEGWILAANGDRIRMSPTGWKKLLAASGSR
jgi:two-component system LytT family response regulator